MTLKKLYDYTRGGKGKGKGYIGCQLVFTERYIRVRLHLLREESDKGQATKINTIQF
jgi:hypothetical protein